MRFLSSLIMVAMIAPFAFGQRNKPLRIQSGDSAVLFSKPPAAALSRFSHPTGAYSATFAGKPVSSRSTEGGILVIAETARRPGSSQRAVLVVLNEDFGKTFSYENYRQSRKKTANEGIVRETESTLDGRTALQFDSMGGSTRRITRVVADNRRIFEFEFSIESWPEVEKSPARVAAVEQEAARYFDSVRINPEPEVKIPVDIFGEWGEREYVNNFLGFTLPFDARFTPVEISELEAMQARTAKAFRTGDAIAEAQLREAIKEEIVLGGLKQVADDKSRPVVLVSVRRVGPYYTLWELAENSMAAFSKVENIEIVGSFKSASIGREPYVSWSMEGYYGPKTMHQTIFVFLRNGFAIVLAAISDDKLKTAEFVRVIEKTRWNPQAPAKKPSK